MKKRAPSPRTVRQAAKPKRYASQARVFVAPSQFMQQRSERALDDGGVPRRMHGWGSPSSGPNSALFSGLERTRNDSRTAVAKDGFARRLVDNLVANVIDTGIRPRTPYPDLQKLWEDWTDEADSRGQLNFYGLQALAFRSMIEGGDCFIRFRTRRPGEMDTVPLQLQVLEAEHVPLNKTLIGENGNAIIGGVERDATDEAVAYWMYRHHPAEHAASVLGSGLSEVRVPAADVCQLMNVRRPGEARGEPWLKPVLPALLDVRKYDDAERVRKNAAAMHGGFIRTPGAPDVDEVVARVVDDGATFADVVVDPLEPGTFPVLPPGFSVEFSKPADLGRQYEAFMRHQLMSIAVAVSSTYEQLTHDWRGTNDRTYRASMLEFTRMVRSSQWHLVVFQFCRPVWRRFVSEAILSGAWTPQEGVSMRDVMRCRWDMPARGYINPLQEVAAYIQAVAAGFTSQERVANELGNESAEIDIENARAKARSEAAGLSYTVFSPQSAGAAAVMAAAVMAGDDEPSEIEQDVAAIEEAALADEVEKVAPAEGAKPRQKPGPAPTPEPAPTA